MALTPRVRLLARELENRLTPATLPLSFADTTPGFTDVFTVRLVSGELQILDDGVVVASQDLASTDSVVVTGTAADGDSLIADYSTEFFTVPITFATETGATGTVTGVGTTINTVSLDFSSSTQAITADIRDDDPLTPAVVESTEVGFDGGGKVTVLGSQVSRVVGTALDDTFIETTDIEFLALDGGSGNDTYDLTPGSTIAITDSGGTDKIDLSRNTEAVSAKIGGTAELGSVTVEETEGDGEVLYNLELVFDENGDVVLDEDGGAVVAEDEAGNPVVLEGGPAESLVATAGDDVIIDETTIEVLTLDGGVGNDVYALDLNAGTTVSITDESGTDAIDLSTTTDFAVVAAIGDDDGDAETVDTYVELDSPEGVEGEVLFDGQVEEVVGTPEGDTFIDLTTVEELTLEGGDGSDTYDLLPGSKINVVETSGNDTILLNRITIAGVNANLTTGKITYTSSNSSEVAITNSNSTANLVENLVGTQFPDIMVGNDANNRLEGGTGDDVLDGKGGNDTYSLIPGGSDVVIDAGGTDTIDFSRSVVGVKVDLGRTNGSPQKITAANDRLSINGVVERVIGGAGDDDLSGGNGDDVLVGGGGRDKLQGQSGDDVLVGGDEDDDLNGGPGRDILVGGRGADRLNGTSGEDILIAGYTVYDDTGVNLAAWSAIQEAWSAPIPTGTRVANLRREDAPYRLTTLGSSTTPATVFNNDGAADKLTGASGPNWFFFLDSGTTRDTIADKNKGDFFNDQ